MKKNKEFVNKNIICDVCKYQNKPEYIKYSGVCHLCGKVLDERAYFKAQMSKRLKLWRGKRFVDWSSYK